MPHTRPDAPATIRPATASDAQGIATVAVTAWQAAYRGLLPGSLLESLSIQDKAKRWRARHAEGANHTLVLEHQGRIIGFVNMGASRDDDADPQVGEIYAIYLLPSAWGQGYGRALCTRALDGLRQQGFTTVTLWTLHNNARAIKFYQAAGFQADGATKVDIKGEGVALHEARYRRSL
jgi:ribosomal protein S18 acetylase RimI-like enzyme